MRRFQKLITAELKANQLVNYLIKVNDLAFLRNLLSLIINELRVMSLYYSQKL